MHGRKKFRVMALFLSVVLLFSALPPVEAVFALQQSADGFVKVTVIGDNSVLIPEMEIPFDYLAQLDLSEYGILSGEIAEGYTALHAVLAALIYQHGPDWCKNSANLVIDSKTGYISTIGNLAMGGADDWSWYSGWFAALNYDTQLESGISQTPIYTGDTVIFYYYISTSDTYAFFEDREIEARTSEPVDIVLKGIGVEWDSPSYGKTISVEGAVVTDGVSDYGLTDSQGKLSVTFDTPGTHILTARLPDGQGNNLLTYAECRVTVSGMPVRSAVTELPPSKQWRYRFNTAEASRRVLDLFRRNEDALKVLIEQAELLNYEDYKMESWKPFSQALSKAKEVFTREDATQAQINAARAVLTEAVEALEEAGRQESGGMLSDMLSNLLNRCAGVLHESGAGVYTLHPEDDTGWRHSSNIGEDLGQGDVSGKGAFAGTVTLTKNRAALPGKPKTTLVKIYDLLDKFLSEISKRAEKSDWEEIVSILSGHSLSEEKRREVVQRIQENGGYFRLVTDLAKTTLMLQISGVDITDFAGVNLLESIYNHDNLGKQGINGYIFSLMVMSNANGPENTKNGADSVIKSILAAQNADGGFPLAAGSASNPDIAAMALQALAPYVQRDEVAAAVDKALAYFEMSQEEDGNFRHNETAFSETLSQLIIALTSLGINPDHPAYVKNGRTLLETLITYRKGDGKFAHFEGGTPDEIATEQAALAFVAYANFFEGKFPVYMARREAVETEIMEAEKEAAI